MAKNDQALPTLEKKTWDDFRNFWTKSSKIFTVQ